MKHKTLKSMLDNPDKIDAVDIVNYALYASINDNEKSLHLVELIVAYTSSVQKQHAARFHPSEKVREGAIKVALKALGKVEWNAPNVDTIPVIINALISAGYIQEQQAETGENKDAEKAFESYYEKEIPNDIKKYLKVSDRNFLRQGYIAGFSSRPVVSREIEIDRRGLLNAIEDVLTDDNSEKTERQIAENLIQRLETEGFFSNEISK